MSGGHFGYQQHSICNIRQSIEELVEENGKSPVDEYDYTRNYSKSTIREFNKAIEILKKARVYAQRIDWLVCDDDSEETFHERIKEELDEINKEL